MHRVEKRAVKSQLIRLMSHVIKWKCQPERRCASWAVTIRSAQNEIEDSQEEVPSLNRNYIESIWDKGRIYYRSLVTICLLPQQLLILAAEKICDT